ncbi:MULTISPECIES: SDR family oxidoreductase [Streptomyces]|uniref:SDR family oxidoreductase n=1 Tax=Streptomyces TaxID=1883 RepID=UPI001CC240A0|nr:SDR family oxidoreductase [Streptomyces venezuelae]
MDHLPEEESDAQQIEQEINALGRRTLLLPGDLSDADFCAETVRRTVDELGGLNILVSNAAYLNSQKSIAPHLVAQTPLGRVAQPEEIAPACVYLAGDADSSYTIGETIAATGGYTDFR